jgi:hypothetical protein
MTGRLRLSSVVTRAQGGNVETVDIVDLRIAREPPRKREVFFHEPDREKSAVVRFDI